VFAHHQELENWRRNAVHYDYYLVIDLEATCCDSGTIPQGETEIIEIGAVMADARSLQPVDEFGAFVRPVRYPILTEFCTHLTSITQQDVDNASGFPDVLARLIQWASKYPNSVFSSWGEYDRKQLARDCSFHRVRYPFEEHVNLKRRFAEALGLRKPEGMAPALRRVGLPLQGSHHRGIDDARNIVRLLPYILAHDSQAGQSPSR
jgi:inhibitor of KinA sporulation pathway (predicted exonuclease)